MDSDVLAASVADAFKSPMFNSLASESVWPTSSLFSLSLMLFVFNYTNKCKLDFLVLYSNSLLESQWETRDY